MAEISNKETPVPDAAPEIIAEDRSAADLKALQEIFQRFGRGTEPQQSTAKSKRLQKEEADMVSFLNHVTSKTTLTDPLELCLATTDQKMKSMSVYKKLLAFCEQRNVAIHLRADNDYKAPISVIRINPQEPYSASDAAALLDAEAKTPPAPKKKRPFYLH